MTRIARPRLVRVARVALFAVATATPPLGWATTISPPPTPAVVAYIGCVGVGDPADIGVCIDDPFPGSLPLPEPSDVPVPL